MLGFSHSGKILARISLRQATTEAQSAQQHSGLTTDVKWALGGLGSAFLALSTAAIATGKWLHDDNLRLRAEVDNRFNQVDSRFNLAHQDNIELRKEINGKFDKIENKLEDIIKNQNPRPPSPRP